MKPRPLTIITVLLILAVPVWAGADLVPPDSKHVGRCVTIENLTEYPGFVFIGVSRLGNHERGRRVIEPDQCLTKGYKLNQYSVYAVRRAHFKKVGLEKLKLEDNPAVFPARAAIEPEGPWVDEDSPLKREALVYHVLGFKDGLVLIHHARTTRIIDGWFGDKEEVIEHIAPKVEGVTADPGGGS